MKGSTAGVLLLLALSSCSRPKPRKHDSKGMPSKISKWTRADTPERFDLDGLFLHIDGGAQVYEEYGFKSLTTASYCDPQGRKALVEIFQMDDSWAAIGVFSYKRGTTSGKAVSVGEGAWEEEFFLNFFNGPYLVTISAKTKGLSLVPLAKGISKSLPPLQMKALARNPAGPILPRERLVPGTWVRFQGPCGLKKLLDDYPLKAPLPVRGEAGLMRDEKGQEVRVAVLYYGNLEEGSKSELLIAAWPGEEVACLRTGPEIVLVLGKGAASVLKRLYPEKGRQGR